MHNSYKSFKMHLNFLFCLKTLSLWFIYIYIYLYLFTNVWPAYILKRLQRSKFYTALTKQLWLLYCQVRFQCNSSEAKRTCNVAFILSKSLHIKQNFLKEHVNEWNSQIKENVVQNGLNVFLRLLACHYIRNSLASFSSTSMRTSCLVTLNENFHFTLLQLCFYHPIS